MPFIDSKVSVKVTPEQKTELKQRLGQAIAIIPGKSEINSLEIKITDQVNIPVRQSRTGLRCKEVLKTPADQRSFPARIFPHASYRKYYK